jgi:hypothetical protein
MKRSLIAICAIAIFVFAGCMEKGPPINFSAVTYKDTTYLLSAVPNADVHNVLAEEFTGQSCANCPAAHDVLNGLAVAGRLNTVGLYFTGSPQTVPPDGAANDFRTVDATEISANIYAGGPQSGIPSGGIDRIPVAGALLLYSTSWSDAYNQRLSVADSVNLSVSSTYNATDSTATIIATVTYLYQVTTNQSLSVVITEDSIKDFQERPTGIDSNYMFNNVFRDMVTFAPTGDVILPAATMKEPGRVVQRVYSYKVNGAWNKKHCNVIAFVSYVNNAAAKDVWQSVKAKLAP